MLGADDILELALRIKKFAARKWQGLRSEQLDDLEGYAILEFTRGRNPKTAYSHVIHDFLRTYEFKVGQRAGADIMLQTRPIKNTKSGELVVPVPTTAPLKTPIKEILEKVELAKEDRVLLILRYVWGFDNEELADIFDVTKQHITYRFWNIHNYLREKLDEDEIES